MPHILSRVSDHLAGLVVTAAGPYPGWREPEAAADASREPSRRLVLTLLALLLVGGFWLRAHNLGALGFDGDEGIQALAVQGVLAHGVPKVPSGVVYTRGLPFIYLQAGAAWLWGLDEFSLRLPAVLFGVATIVVAYALGAAVFDRWVGLVMAGLVTFSTWEIELSRYGRFYTAFQCFYGLALVLFYRGFMLGRRAQRWWFVPVAVVTLLMHSLGVMLATCFLIPLFSQRFSARQKWISVLWGAGVVGMWKLTRMLVGQLNALGDPLDRAGRSATSFVPRLKGAIKDTWVVPNLTGVFDLLREHPLLLATFALIPVAASLALCLVARRRDQRWPALAALPIVWAAFFHQFGLVVMLWCLYVALFVRSVRGLGARPLFITYAAAGLSGLWWMVWLGADTAQWSRLLWSYPRFYRYFLSWFLAGWPVLSMVCAVGGVLLWRRWLAHSRETAPLFALGCILLPAAITSLLYSPFYEARYTFHLYLPLLMLFAVVVITCSTAVIGRLPSTSRPVAIAVLAPLMLFLSQDANPVDAQAIGQRTYASPRDRIRGHVNDRWLGQFHEDLKGPSQHVGSHLRSDDVLIVVGLPHHIAIVRHYVGRVDYAVEERVGRFHLRLKDGRILAHVAGSRILTSVEALREVIRNAPGRVWIIGHRMELHPGNPRYSSAMKDELRPLTANPDVVGGDGQSVAARLR